MIYTLTFNPSLDYIMHVDSFVEGKTNRSSSEEIYPGGKGFNVSIVLTRLGIDNIALGFVAGFTGVYIEQTLPLILLLIEVPRLLPKSNNVFTTLAAAFR